MPEKPLQVGEVGQRLGVGQALRRRELVLEAPLLDVEGRREVEDGLAVRTSVRLRARPPWFSGFFGNAAAAAIAAASSVGITAVGSNGLPASPQ